MQAALDLRQSEDDDRRVDGGDEHAGHDHDHGEAGVSCDRGLLLQLPRRRLGRHVAAG